MARTDFDIVIIGGGMVGISQALLLEKANPDWRIALIDRSSLSPCETPIQASFDARATALAAGSQQVFQALGLWADLSAQACPISKVHISDKGHFGGNQITASEQRLEAVGYVVENRYLGRSLLSALSDSNVVCFGGCQVERLMPEPLGYRIELTNGEQLEADLTIIADGANSALARQLGIETDQRSYQQCALITTIELSVDHNNTAYERFTDSGPMALLPLVDDLPVDDEPIDGVNPLAARLRQSAGQKAFSGQSSKRMALVWTLTQEQAKELTDCDQKAFCARLQRHFGYRAGQFVRAGQRHSYPLHLMLAREQVRAHLLLLGNAAHFLHPVAGQGFNLALRDCVALAQRLSEVSSGSLGDLEHLQGYLARQGTDQALTVGFSDKLIDVFGSRHCALQVGRQLGFLGLEVMPIAKTLLAKQTMGQALV